MPCFPGKVRFLQALKDRILNFSHLGKAVKDAQQLQTVQRMIKQSDQEKDARHTFECHEQAPDQLSECPSGSDEHTYSHTSKTPNRKYLPQHPDQKCDFQMKPSTLVNKLSENTQAASRILQKNKCGELHKHPCSGGHPAGSHDQVQGISISKSITVQEDPQDCILAGPPEKRQKLDIKPVPGSYTDSQGKGGTKSSMTIPAKQQTESVSGVQGRGSDSVTSFRFSVKCGGWCKKWLKPQVGCVHVCHFVFYACMLIIVWFSSIFFVWFCLFSCFDMYVNIHLQITVIGIRSLESLQCTDNFFSLSINMLKVF